MLQLAKLRMLESHVLKYHYIPGNFLIEKSMIIILLLTRASSMWNKLQKITQTSAMQFSRLMFYIEEAYTKFVKMLFRISSVLFRETV